MTFLPIVQRELGVAARRRSTFRVRWWTTALAMACSLVSLGIFETSTHLRGVGAPLFGLICWYAFGLCVLSGVFLSADSLSAEKREGTLGLLFLSHLKGYDVVLGKFMALGLNAFYCLLALLPSAALCLLLGGVTAGQLWRGALALGNALFFSLAAGMAVSAFGRQAQRSTSAALALLLFLAAGLPLGAVVIGKLLPSPAWIAVAHLSPFYAVSYSAEANYTGPASGFWPALVTSGLCGCALLGLASVVLPRGWRERGRAPRKAGVMFARPSPSPARVVQRTAARAELLTRNPVQWLTGQQLGTQWGAWVIVAAWGLVVLAALAFGASAASSPLVTGYFVLPFGFFLKLLFAVQATRFFGEGRRNGALDFLLCTPLTNREIVDGQAKALWNVFLWPLIVFVALLLAPVTIRLTEALFARNLDPVLAAASGSFLAGLFAIRLGMDLVAVCWFGMALALTSRRPSLAAATTVLFVLILPSLFSFCWLDIVADIFFIAWGRAKLRQDLRQLVAREYLSAIPPVWPVPPRASPAPPASLPPIILK